MLLYGVEEWGLGKTLEDLLIKCDRMMLRYEYMANITWRDDMGSKMKAKRCSDGELSCTRCVRKIPGLM